VRRDWIQRSLFETSKNTIEVQIPAKFAANRSAGLRHHPLTLDPHCDADIQILKDVSYPVYCRLIIENKVSMKAIGVGEACETGKHEEGNHCR
jgi:hypothetical protein